MRWYIMCVRVYCVCTTTSISFLYSIPMARAVRDSTTTHSMRITSGRDSMVVGDVMMISHAHQYYVSLQCPIGIYSIGEFGVTYKIIMRSCYWHNSSLQFAVRNRGFSIFLLIMIIATCEQQNIVVHNYAYNCM